MCDSNTLNSIIADVTADVTAVTNRHELGAHSYTDDTQLYAHYTPASYHEWSARMPLCIGEIEKWMKPNRVKVNKDMTQFTWLGQS